MEQDKRNILITSADGQTGHCISELLLTEEDFSKNYDSLLLLATNVSKCQDLTNHGAQVLELDPAKAEVADLTKMIQESQVNTIMLIPPTHPEKLEITKKFVDAVKQAQVPNIVLLSSAGCDMAERDKQPRLREFVDMEKMVMECKGDPSTLAGHCPVVIRAGFYAENLLLYNKNAQNSGKLPLPLGTQQFAPVALGDVSLLAAHILIGKGQHGLDDNHRGQLITLTGPQLCAGPELATSASEALGGIKLEFQDISLEEASAILDENADVGGLGGEGLDSSEKQYLLEYYEIVREGKANYVSTLAFIAATGGVAPQDMPEFFKSYGEEFKPKKRRTRK